MSEWLILPAIISGLIILHGLFVAAEFSMIGIRPDRLHELIAQRNRKASGLQHILDDPLRMDHYITTSQLGITIASLALGMTGVYGLTNWLLAILAQWQLTGLYIASLAAFIIAISLLTLVQVIVSDIIPKSLALHDPERTAMRIEPFMWLMKHIALPLVLLLNILGNSLLRLLNIPRIESHRRLYSPEELALVVMESHKGGLLSDDEQRIIQKIFDLSERRVGQVMTPRPRIEAIEANTQLQELLDQVALSPYSRFPVYEGDMDHIVGLLLVKDFVRQQLEQPSTFDLKALLRHMPAVPEAMTVDRLLVAFKHSHIHMALVFDEYGGTAGLVTLEDVVEEVVGEVHDEFDEIEQPLLYEVEPGMFFARGDLMLDDLSEIAPGILPEDEDEELPDVDTVGGLVVSLLGRPARPGDQIELGETTFTVESVSGFAVDMVRIIYHKESTEETESTEEH
jgi:CBS domain containing-hemolysin-like protein